MSARAGRADSSVARTCRRVIAVAAPLVPSDLRAEWREEWESELWYAEERMRTGSEGVPLARTRLLLRALGAVPHALSLRFATWSLDGVRQDLRYAFRALSRRPLLVGVSLATLAVANGGVTAMFSLVYGVLLRPLPFHNPERLVWARGVFSGGDGASVSPPDYVDYRARNRTFEEFAAMTSFGAALTLTGGDRPTEVRSAAVTANFMRALGIQPAHGRMFREEETAVATASVAMISSELWHARYGGDPGVLGRTIVLNGAPHEIIGVVPAALAFPSGRDVWLPLTFANPDFQQRAAHFLRPVGRLRPGVTLAAAQAEMDAIALQLEREYPQSNTTWRLGLMPLHEQLTGNARPALILLFGAVVLVLLIACANVANLLLAQSAARRGEMAVRAALGAARRRILRQVVLESVLLTVAGGLAGVLLALGAVAALRNSGAVTLPRMADVTIDGPVLLFALAVSVMTGLIFGLVPGLPLSATGLGNTLRQTGRGRDAPGQRARSLLIVAEIALSVTLVTGASLLLRSLGLLQREDPGFEPSNTLVARMQFPEARYADVAATDRTARELRARLLALPGVAAVGAINAVPIVEGAGDTRVYAADRPPAEGVWTGALVRIVTPGYFEAMGIPVVHGRAPDDRDVAATGRVVLINLAMAAAFFPDRDPLGQDLMIGLQDPLRVRIIGVVGDVRQFQLAAPPRPEFYVPLAQSWGVGGLTYVVRARDTPAALLDDVRAVIVSIDPEQPVSLLQPMSALLTDSVADSRFRTRLLGTFAALALVLAVLGVYGIVAFSVAQRTRELGVRLALGAQPGRIVRGVIGDGARLAAAGLMLGVSAALIATRWLESLLYGVQPRDPASFALTSAVIMLAALAACWIPARRAARVDAAVALRGD